MGIDRLPLVRVPITIMKEPRPILADTLLNTGLRGNGAGQNHSGGSMDTKRGQDMQQSKVMLRSGSRFLATCTDLKVLEYFLHASPPALNTLFFFSFLFSNGTVVIFFSLSFFFSFFFVF